MTLPEVKEESESQANNGQICRLCMSEETLDEEFKNDQLKEWIWEYLAIKISIDDRMSQVVCTICRIRMTEFHQFRMRCHEVQELLQALIPDEADGVESGTATVQTDPNAANQLQEIETQDDTLIRCEVCRAVFKDEEQLTDHKKIHGTEKIKCSMCEESFSTRESLYNHLKVHTSKGSETIDITEDLEIQECTQIKSEQTENVEKPVQTSESTSKAEREVSSFWIRTESNYVDSESKEDPLCEQVESAPNFQDNEMENDPLGIEDCVVVEEARVNTKNSKTFLKPNLEMNNGDKNRTAKRKLSRSRNVIDSSDSDEPDSESTDSNSDSEESDNDSNSNSEGSDSDSKESDSDSEGSDSDSEGSDPDSKKSDSESKESDSDNAEEVEQRAKSGNSDEGYKCSECDRTFTRECRLKVHMTVHEEKESEESSLEDETSDKSDNSDASDEDQENEKENEQDFQCDICPKIFPTRAQLTSHKKYHRKKQAALDKESETNTEKKDSEHNIVASDAPASVEREVGENQILQCDVCQKTCLTRKILLKHKRIVHGPRRHGCEICDVHYTLRCEMTRHVRTKKHLNNVQEKIRLEKEESSNRNMKVRKAAAKLGKSKKIKDTKSIADALFAKYGSKKDDEQMKCNVCDKMFLNRWDLGNHKKYHRPIKIFCPVCERPCYNSAVLRKHLPTHLPIDERQKAKPQRDIENAPRPFKCDICQTAYMDKGTLWGHNQLVHGPKNFECEMCGFRFATNDLLKNHMQTHALRGHTKEDFLPLKKLYQQNDVSTNQNDDDEMSDQSSVSSENETNENDNAHKNPSKSDKNCSELPFQCGACKKAFETSVLLYRHNRRAHKPKKFKCSVCGKCFAFRQQKNMHMKIHKLESTTTKDFECPKCYKIYKSWNCLYQHWRDHHVRNKTLPDDRNFSCLKCDKKFHTSQRLSMHMRVVHTAGEHKCDICKKKFSIRVQLWQHMNTQHGKKSASADDEETTEESDFEESVPHSNEVSRKQPQRSAKMKKGIKRKRK